MVTCDYMGYSNFNVGTHANALSSEDERQLWTINFDKEDENKTISLSNECEAV